MFKYKYKIYYKRYLQVKHKDGTPSYVEGSAYVERINLWGLILTLIRGSIEPKLVTARQLGGRFVIYKIVKEGRRL